MRWTGTNTKSWQHSTYGMYYNLWELCHRLDVVLELENEHHLRPIRERDRLIIDLAIEKGYCGKRLEMINVVRE